MKEFKRGALRIPLTAILHGYDTPQLYRKDMLERICRLERDCNDSARRMNEIIKKGKLPEKPVPLPFPEEEADPDCE